MKASSTPEELKELVIKVRDARAQADGATSAFNQGKMDWPTFNTYLVEYRKLDGELRSKTRKFHRDAEKNLKKKYSQ